MSKDVHAELVITRKGGLTVRELIKHLLTANQDSEVWLSIDGTHLGLARRAELDVMGVGDTSRPVVWLINQVGEDH